MQCRFSELRYSSFVLSLTQGLLLTKFIMAARALGSSEIVFTQRNKLTREFTWWNGRHNQTNITSICVGNLSENPCSRVPRQVHWMIFLRSSLAILDRLMILSKLLLHCTKIFYFKFVNEEYYHNTYSNKLNLIETLWN